MATFVEIKNCYECPHHKIYNDPDPYDSFCDDDIAVKCELCKGEPKKGLMGEYRMGKPMITVACRPYNIKKECAGIPDWCPLNCLDNKK